MARDKTAIYVVCLVMVVLLVFSFKSRFIQTMDNVRDIRKKNAPVVETLDYLIPPESELKGLSDKQDLNRIYWRYANTIQVLCRNQIRLGILKDGGKETCIDKDFIPKKPCLVYSFGSALKFSFEESVNRAFGCEIHTFDPTVEINDNNKNKIPAFVNFHKTGLAGKDFVTDKKWQMCTLGTIMKDLNHTHKPIDILKIDIEGWEFAALDQAIKAGSLKTVKQLLIEIHFLNDKFVEKLGTLRGLYDQGFRIFMRDRNPVLISPLVAKFTTQYTPLVEMNFINMRHRK